ncbi:MAG: ATP-binding protein, partial [Armatimonadetes bacterium]|nr:ATP-binding protein [Anaerolineae bacterium]
QGEIRFTVQRQDDHILFTVKDTGTGIDPEDHDTIFEAFRQARGGLRQGGGTGLGLPISKRLAEAHNGRLWLTSAVGVGTTFYVLIPIASLSMPPIANQAQAKP